MRSGAKFAYGQSIGWWGCSSCKRVVANNHTGPCLHCGGMIGRMVPNVVRLDADLGIVLPLRDVVPKPVEPPARDWTNIVLFVSAVSCVLPLLGASSVGWSVIALVMAMNIWSSSISYYALMLAGKRERLVAA